MFTFHQRFNFKIYYIFPFQGNLNILSTTLAFIKANIAYNCFYYQDKSWTVNVLKSNNYTITIIIISIIGPGLSISIFVRHYFLCCSPIRYLSLLHCYHQGGSRKVLLELCFSTSISICFILFFWTFNYNISYLLFYSLPVSITVYSEHIPGTACLGPPPL